MSDPEQGGLPEAQEILIHRPIYWEHDISAVSSQAVWQFQYFQGSVDAYCIECRRTSIFESEVQLPQIPLVGPQGAAELWRPSKLEDATKFLDEGAAHGDRTFEIELSCTRERKHLIWFFFLVRNKTLRKVGQYPSIADFELPKLARFNKVLDESQRREFGRAVGLYAHGVGIGSFVYLRRIFEFLIEKAHQVAAHQENWDTESEKSYSRAPMDKKILLLKEYLPTLLVQNAGIYSILSTGIHQLDEDECKEFFATLRRGIEMILDEQLEKLRKQQHEKELKNEIGRIKGKVRRRNQSEGG